MHSPPGHDSLAIQWDSITDHKYAEHAEGKEGANQAQLQVGEGRESPVYKTTQTDGLRSDPLKQAGRPSTTEFLLQGPHRGHRLWRGNTSKERKAHLIKMRIPLLHTTYHPQSVRLDSISVMARQKSAGPRLSGAFLPSSHLRLLISRGWLSG